MRNRTKWILFVTSAVTIVCCGLLIATLKNGRTVDHQSASMTLHMFDVGQGESLFVELQDGTQMLIDGGPDETVLAHLGRVMPPWDRTIDIIVLTHPHADHLVGLIDVLDRYQVNTVVLSPAHYDTRVYEVFLEAVANEGSEVVVANGQILKDGSVSARIMYPSESLYSTQPDDVNDASVVLEIYDEKHRFLLTGDVGEEVESQLIESGMLQDIDVLKVGHHGSHTSSSRKFLEVTQPEIALISLGVNNRYHHPHPSTLKRLEQSGVAILRTDLDGSVIVRSFEDDLQIVAGNHIWLPWIHRFFQMFSFRTVTNL